MIFIFKSAITLALLYCCFFAFLSKETFHRFNRVALLGIVIASLLVPFIHITTKHPTIVNETVARLQNEFNVVEKANNATQTISFTWSDWVIICYMIMRVMKNCGFVQGGNSTIRTYYVTPKR